MPRRLLKGGEQMQLTLSDQVDSLIFVPFSLEDILFGLKWF
jgi:hypothetical protein